MDAKTKNLEETFLEIVADFHEADKCESQNCREGRVECSGTPVAAVFHHRCKSPSRNICASAVIYNAGRMAVATCAYCNAQGNYIPAMDCWEILPL